MKTVIDAVNELKGDLNNGRSTGDRFHRTHNKLEFTDGSWYLLANNALMPYVCTIEEFNQCVAEMSEAKWVPESKPIFTQAMADAGELPPVGVRVMIESRGIKLEGYRVHGGVVCIGSKLCGFTPDSDLVDAIYSPIQTEREKAIDEMLMTAIESKDDIAKSIIYEACVKLHNAGYRKTEQAK